MSHNIGMAKNWLEPFLKAAKISQEKLGDELDLSRATINRLANDHSQLKKERAERMAPLLGVTVDDLMLNRPPRKPLIASFDEDEVPPDEVDPDWDGGGHVDGRIVFEGKIQGSSPEFAATPGMGQGQFEDRSARVVSNGIASGHPVVNEWFIPPAYVRNALDATPSQIMILPVIGHSMEPILKANDRVMVDVSQNTWIGDAVYIIDNGLGVLQAKTVKHVAPSNPPRFRIVSEASPDEEPVILSHDEFRIVGRVVGRFTRM